MFRAKTPKRKVGGSNPPRNGNEGRVKSKRFSHALLVDSLKEILLWYFESLQSAMYHCGLA